MQLTRTAYGTWSGGRFMHFGEPIDDERFIRVVRLAYESGVRTFMTADVYGNGAADSMLGQALSGLPRESYCLVAAVGHDFYSGKRDGSKGFPRFTASGLRSAGDYRSYLRMATEKCLERCRTNYFDAVLLHNPDAIGYSSDTVWKGMAALKDAKLTEMLGVAPGPANGFTLDLILNFERFAGLIDWAMIILNPLEPWPGMMCLPAAEKHGVKVITRVVDYGGLFHDDVKPGHKFGSHDHRAFRPAGWVEAGSEKIERMRPIAAKHHLTLLQLSCLWNLSQPAVESVIPTLIQETGESTKPIEEKLLDLARLPEIKLDSDDVSSLLEIGNNKGCMHLKGGSSAHQGPELPDQWSLNADLLNVANRWEIDPSKDLVYAHAS